MWNLIKKINSKPDNKAHRKRNAQFGVSCRDLAPDAQINYINHIDSVSPMHIERREMYTVEDVHRDLTAFTLLFLSNIEQEIERKEVPTTISHDVALLSEFGLTNSKNAVICNNFVKEVAAHNKEYDSKKASLTFMSDVLAKFGKDAMVVRYDHFFQILEKYDMVCGSFDRYTGSIPQEALNMLSSLKELWNKGQFHFEYGLPLGYASSFTFRDESCDIVRLRNRARMPMRVSDANVMQQIARLCLIKDLGCFTPRGLECLNDALFIAAPTADMKPLRITINFDVRDSLNVKRARKKAEDELGVNLWRYPNMSADLIRHAENDAILAEETRLQSIIEESDIDRYCDIDLIKTQPLPKRMLYDPFICSLTPYGVLIHAKWGPEAEDATIKRYEQLRDAIMGNKQKN